MCETFRSLNDLKWHVSYRSTKKGGLLIKTSEWKTLPEVANMPPTIPQRRTKKPQNDLWRLSTRTIMDDMSYLKKIPWKTKHWLLQQS